MYVKMVSRALIKQLAAPAAIVILVLFVFMPAQDTTFVNWDDDDLLLANTRYQTVNSESLQWMFTTSYAGHFQPLTWLSYALDYALWRGNPFGYRLTNVILHAFAALAFYFVARRLLAAASADVGDATGDACIWPAAFAAAVFACHPLRAESVAWIAERRDVLGGFLYILTVAFYLRYVSARRLAEQELSSTTGPGKPAWVKARGALLMLYATVVITCGLSLLAKATAITLPLVLLILDVYPLRRMHGDLKIRNSPDAVVGFTGLRWRVLLEKLPLFVLALAGGVRALIAQAEGGALLSVSEHDWAARFAQACHGLTFYVWKTIWPANLGPLYQIPSRDVLLGPTLWLHIGAIIACIYVTARLRRRWPALAVALAIYAVILAPVLGFAQSGPQLVADRYSYLSCSGFAILAGYALLWLHTSAPLRAASPKRAVLAFIALLCVAGLGLATSRQVKIWRNPLTLWAHGARVSNTSSIAHVNYADALAAAKLYDEAANHYATALTLDPQDAVALHHLGDLHLIKQRPEAAIRYYIRALSIDPNRRGAPLSLAQLLVDQGRPHQAVMVLRDSARRQLSRNRQHGESIIRHSPLPILPSDTLRLIDYLAELLTTYPDTTVRNGEEAVTWAELASDAQGNAHAPSLLTLATALAEAGRFAEAVETAEKALEIAQRDNDIRLAKELGHRLTLFRQGTTVLNRVSTPP